jgi:hypothetical protein
MNDYPAFSVPSGEEITVKLINPANFGPSQLHRFMAPPIPGMETLLSNPSFSFLIEHASGRRLVFDLGIRKDYQNYAPKIAEYIPTTKYNIEAPKNVIDILKEGGIEVQEIEAIIWRYISLFDCLSPSLLILTSHWHWDHIGDPSTFPPTTDLIVGPGFKEAMLPGAPANPESPIRESDYE